MEDALEDRLRDTKEQATRLGLSESYLEKLRVRGEGPPFVKIGRAVRYRDSDADEWIAARVVSSTSELRAA